MTDIELAAFVMAGVEARVMGRKAHQLLLTCALLVGRAIRLILIKLKIYLLQQNKKQKKRKAKLRTSHKKKKCHY